jgi:single-strand DNA-binding protein
VANFNLNQVILGGRLTSDPELKTTPSGISVTSFTVAINRGRAKEGEEQQADFINCTAWRQTAEFVTRYFSKGSSICVLGSIQTRSWTDQEGNKRFATEVLVNEVKFVDSKNESQQSASAQSGAYIPESYTNPTPAPQFEQLADDEELPF